jgi:hypothetical protein
MLLSVLGFWNIYLEAGAAPNPYHHLHLVTNFLWLFLLLYQLRLVGRKRPVFTFVGSFALLLAMLGTTGKMNVTERG